MFPTTAPSGVPLARDGQLPLWRDPALLLAAALFLGRALYLPWVNLLPEEAYYWNYAQHLDFGYLDHPPMVAWLIALGTRVCGQTEWGVRACALGCSLLTSFFAGRLATLLHGRRAGTLAVLLVQGLPFFFVCGGTMTPDAPLTACWAGTLYFLARALLAREARAWLGVGVWLGLGLLSKYTIVLVGAGALLFLALDGPVSRGWFRRVPPYLAAALAAGIFSPVIWWNMTHHWASFGFQSTSRLRQPPHFALPELLGSVLVILTPVGFWLAWRAARAGAATHGEERRHWRFAWTFTLVPLGVFVAFSVRHNVKFNWTGPLWLALVPALAAQLAGTLDARLRAATRVSAVGLAAAYLGLLQHLGFGLPGVPYARDIALFPAGWPQMGQELAAQQAALRQRTGGGRVLIVGMDHNFIASEAAFYHPDRPRSVADVAGAHLFGSPSLMYAYWFSPAAQDGAALVLASFNSHWLNSKDVTSRCREMEPTQDHVIRLHGRTVCHYYTRVALGYHSTGLVENAGPK